MPRAISRAPVLPIVARMTAVAGTRVSARACGPSTRTQTKFTPTYSTITPATPSTSARDRFFRGSLISSAMKLVVCHPPKANSTGTIAAPIAVSRSNDGLRSSSGCSNGWGERTRNSPAAIKPAMAAIFSTINTLCMRLPSFTPRQLIMVSATMVRTTTPRSETCHAVSSSRYRAKVTVTAAMPPVWITSSNAHP